MWGFESLIGGFDSMWKEGLHYTQEEKRRDAVRFLT